MPADEPTAVDPLSPSGHTAHPPAKGKGYSDITWKGNPAYKCDTCDYAVLSKERIEDHVENAAENNERLLNEK